MDLKKKLLHAREENGFVKRYEYTKEENAAFADLQKLPANVFRYGSDDSFYTIPDLENISNEEMIELTLQEQLLTMQEQLSALRTIKNCVVFFTVLTVIGLVGWLLLLGGAF